MKERDQSVTVACPGCGGPVLMYAEGGRCRECGKSVVPCDQCTQPATVHRVVTRGYTVRLEARCEEHRNSGRWHPLPGAGQTGAHRAP